MRRPLVLLLPNLTGFGLALGACVGGSVENGRPDAAAYDASYDVKQPIVDSSPTVDSSPVATAGDASEPVDAADASEPVDAADAAADSADAADAARPVDDIAASFSASANPPAAGHFQYGTTPTLGGAFMPYAFSVVSQGMPFWQATSALNTPPYVAKNTTGAAIVLGGTATIPAGTLWAHPGPTGGYSVIRWACPKSGTYVVHVTFTARDATTSNVAVLKNGATPALFVGDVTTSSTPVYDSGAQAFAAGDLLDFAVGYGTNGTYNQDSTGIDGTIAAQ